MGNTSSVDPINKECPVCMEETNDERIILKCGHQLCTNCTYEFIKMILINKDYISCPLCRKNIKIKSIKKKFWITKMDPKFISRKDIIKISDLNVAKLKLHGPIISNNIQLFFPMEKINNNYKSIYIQTNELNSMNTTVSDFFNNEVNKKIFIKDNEIIGPFNVRIKGNMKPLLKWDIFLRGMLLIITDNIYKNISLVNEVSLYIEDPSEMIIYNQHTGSYKKGDYNFITRNKKIKWKAIFQPLFYKTYSDVFLINRLIGITILNNY